MTKIPFREEPGRSVETILASGSITIGGYKYPVFVPKRPTTVTIYNTAINNDDWTDITPLATMSGVLSWKLRERDGKPFSYAFTAAPATYMTSLGEAIIRDLEITKVYVKRGETSAFTMELEIWS